MQKTLYSASVQTTEDKNYSPKILVTKLRNIGDTVILTSSLKGLRKQFPTAQIHLALTEKTFGLKSHIDSVDSIFCLQSESKLKLAWQLFSLRKENYDYFLGFHATTSLCRLAKLVQAKNTILHHHSRTKTPFWSDHKLAKPGVLQNAIERDWEILRAMGLPFSIEDTFLKVDPIIKKKWADQLGLSVTTLPKLVLLPGARHETRRYPKHHSIHLLEKLLQSQQWFLCVLCDYKLSQDWGLEAICHRAKIPLLQNLSLSEMISVISNFDLAIANDSGPLHIAVALGVETLSFFGPGCIGDWHPYDKEKHRVLRIPVTCRNFGPRDNEIFQYCTKISCSHLTCLEKLPDPFTTLLTIRENIVKKKKCKENHLCL